MRAVIVSLIAFLIAACGDNHRGDIRIVTDPHFEPVLREMVALVPYRGLVLATPDDTDEAAAATTRSSWSTMRRSRSRASG